MINNALIWQLTSQKPVVRVVFWTIIVTMLTWSYVNSAYATYNHHHERCDVNVSNSIELKNALTGVTAQAGDKVCLAEGDYRLNGATDSFNVEVNNLTIVGAPMTHVEVNGKWKKIPTSIMNGQSTMDAVCQEQNPEDCSKTCAGIDDKERARHVMMVDHPYVNKLTMKRIAVINGCSDLGNTDGGTTAQGLGAGMYIKSADVTLKQARIANNVCKRPTNPYCRARSFLMTRLPVIGQ